MFFTPALGAALAAAPAAPAAPAPERPAAVVAYEAAVAETTAAMRAAVPRLATCQKPAAAKLVLKADLTRGAAVTTAALGPSGAAKVAAPCFEKVVQDVLVRTPPRVGTEAAVILDLASGVALEGDVALFGSLPTDAVEAGVRGVLDRVAQCYLVGLAEAPGLSGQLVVSFTVLPDGRAHGPELKRTELWNPTVESCVLRQVATASFAPPQGGAIARVTYPFSFNPPQ